jgi:hypothetical protein
MADNEGIAEVTSRLEQIRADLLVTVKELDRFQNKKELLAEGRDLHRRLGVCINILKKLEKE